MAFKNEKKNFLDFRFDTGGADGSASYGRTGMWVAPSHTHSYPQTIQGSSSNPPPGTIIKTDALVQSCDTVLWGSNPAPCVHEMGEEVELEDGRVSGRCLLCGDTILGRRMVGGLGLARLRAALVDAIGDHDEMALLAEELGRVEMMLELEEQTLDSARKMIDLAKQMLAEVLLKD